MERNYLLGGLLTLVALGVLILIIVTIFPSFGEEIKVIADDVFGISFQDAEAREKETKDLQSTRYMQALVSALDCAVKGKNCVCELKTDGMISEEYKIKIFKDGETYKVELTDNQGIVMSEAELSPKIEDLFMQLSINDNLKTKIAAAEVTRNGDTISIMPVGEPGQKKEILEITPVYTDKDGKVSIVALNDFYGSELHTTLDYFYTKKSCAENTIPGVDESTKFLDKFYNDFVSCSKEAIPPEVTRCECSTIAIFNEWPDNFQIEADINTGRGTNFSLISTRSKKKIIDVSKEPIQRHSNVTFLQGEGSSGSSGKIFRYHDETDKAQQSYPWWAFVKEEDKVTFFPTDVIESRNEKENSLLHIPKCSLGKGGLTNIDGCGTIKTKDIPQICRVSSTGSNTIWSKIYNGDGGEKTKAGRTYYEVISDLEGPTGCEKLIIMGILATESGARKNPPSGDCKGIAQFCMGTGYDFGLCDKKVSYEGGTKWCMKEEESGSLKKTWCTEGKLIEHCDKFDIRTDPDKAIPAAWQHLSRDIQYFKSKRCNGVKIDYSGITELLGIVSYNAGKGVMCNALKEIEKDNPTWEELRSVITVDLMKKSGYKGDTWTVSKLRKKIDDEIACYPYKVYGFRNEFAQKLPEN